MLGVVYALGVVWVLGHFAIAVARIARLEKAMTPVLDPDIVSLKDALCEELRIRRRVDLLQSDRIGSPFTWGVLRPRVVLPVAARDWSADQVRHVLLHELWHVRRCDWARLCIQRVAVAIYWFNPCVWLAARQCAYEAERACDDRVLRSGGRSSDYALLLVELMASSRRAQPAGVALGDRGFAKRIRAILNSTKEARDMSERKTGIVTVSVALTALVLGACQVTTTQPGDHERAQQAQGQPEQLERQAQQQGEQQERQVEQQQQRQVERQERQVEQQQQRQVERQERQALTDSRGLEQQERVEELSRRLEQRKRAMIESQSLVQALRASLDQQRIALAAMERAVLEVQAQVEELSRQ
jgi:beta-lactamase regulating signal transducer with metallopeptidase domain